METVEIPVTEGCNNRCSFCVTAWHMIEKGIQPSDLSRPVVRERLARAHAAGARRVLFNGGEPTLRKDLGEIVEDARSVGYEAVSLFTHARAAATEEGARWIASMPLTSIMVSIHGGTAAAHDAAVGVPGAFVETVEGTRRLVALGREVHVNGVLTRPLLDTLPEYAALMIAIRPRGVGLDTIKPTAAFGEARESYTRLCPKLSPHTGALRDALLAMEQAGVTARLTTFPPCLVPGAEHLVREEPPTVTSFQPSGTSVHKRTWLAGMQVKAEGCARCAYDGVCPGVYAPYAEAYGLDELRPLPRRLTPGEADAPLTHALRALFVRPGTAAPFGVREVRRQRDGSHVLSCFGPEGELRVVVDRREASPVYATTARFGVHYLAGGGARDLRIVDAVVGLLRRAEARLPPS